MNWKIAWISEELDDRLEAVCTQKADFCAVAAVRPGQTAFEEDILYVGKSGDIASGAVLTGTCLLLTKSCKDDPALEHRKKACGFLAYAPAHTDAGLLYEKAKELFRKRAAYCSKEAAILALPAKNFSFQQLARELASIFGNPVAISDVSFKTLGYSDNIDVDDDVWNKYTVTNYSPYEYLQIVQDSGLGAVFENSEPQWSSGAKVQHRRLGCKISINNSMVGWTTLLEIKQTFTDYDIDLLKVTALMLSSEFRKDRHYSASRRTPLEVFVTELLEGTNPNRVILRERAKQVTKYVFGKQYLLVFQKTDTSSHYLALLRSELEMIFDKGFTILYGDVLLLFVPERSSAPWTPVEYEQLLQFVRKYNLRVGVSGVFSDILDIMEYYCLAIKALEAGQMFDRTGFPIYRYSDFSIYHLLEKAGEGIDLTYFLDPLIPELLEYDRNYSTGYTKNLYYYIQSGCNFKIAAEVMGVHRNTMSYRIKKIIDLFDRDLYDTLTVCRLLTSFRILEFTRGRDFIDRL